MTATDGWSVDLAGVTESLVATLGPNDRWNLAPLGLFAPGMGDGDGVTARTWGRTRTRRNFEHNGEGVVQFVRDPVVFVDCALGVVERDEPTLAAADARARVEVERLAAGTEAGTEWVAWALSPVESTVLTRTVPTTRRGYAAVVEASVWASRLDAGGYDRETLEGRIAFLGAVVAATGTDRDRRAFDRIAEAAGVRTEW